MSELYLLTIKMPSSDGCAIKSYPFDNEKEAVEAFGAACSAVMEHDADSGKRYEYQELTNVFPNQVIKKLFLRWEASDCPNEAYYDITIKLTRRKDKDVKEAVKKWINSVMR